MIQQVSGDITRLYLAVHLPLLPSERIKRIGKPPDAPFAIVARIRNAMRILALDSAALTLGLTLDLTLADARARVPELAAFAHDPEADMVTLEWVAEACSRYTPMVAIDATDALVLDITGCTHHFNGGETALAADLKMRLARLCLSARIATASTPDAALAFARYGGADVQKLPVLALAVNADTHVALSRSGLKTIGDVARLPPAPLAARFGTELPVLLDRMLGRTDMRITPRRPVAEIEAEQRFAEPVARTEDVLSTITNLVARATIILSERGVGGRSFGVALFRSDGHVARLQIETAGPVRDAKILDRLFRERIDALSDPLDPGFGYDLIRLHVLCTETMKPEQLRLDGGQLADGELVALIDRLTVRLGRGRVRRFASVDTHIPEQRALELPVSDVRIVKEWPRPEAGEPPMRPVHMFDPPHRIEVMAEVPDGPPRRFKWRRTMYEVARHEGPERIASEWWTRDDNAGLTRDYYRVEDVRGRRYWLFRHGLFGAEKTHPDWYLHGLFA